MLYILVCNHTECPFIIHFYFKDTHQFFSFLRQPSWTWTWQIDGNAVQSQNYYYLKMISYFVIHHTVPIWSPNISLHFNFHFHFNIDFFVSHKYDWMSDGWVNEKINFLFIRLFRLIVNNFAINVVDSKASRNILNACAYMEWINNNLSL